MALAFNCRDELQAMLQDSLPVGAAALGFLLDSEGRVLASTQADITVGSVPDFVTTLQARHADASAPALCQWQGRSYLVGTAFSQGYREFKTSDGYRETVQSVLLTAVDPSAPASPRFALPQQAGVTASSVQYGVVQCGRLWFALASGDVVEAVAATHMAAPAAASDAAGLLKYPWAGELAVLPVLDACALTGQAPIAHPEQAVAIVLRGQGQLLALLVDRLVDVIVCDTLAPPPGGIDPKTPWIHGYIHDGQVHTEPVFAIDPKRLPLAAGAVPMAEAG
jgi:hypothetical protein